ncbi:hypothetical protein O9992_25400 [Vibrio lentus]|nr:hypothetical protein [Vibrio lentus]
MILNCLKRLLNVTAHLGAINSTEVTLPQIDLTAGYVYQDTDRHEADGSSGSVNLGLVQSIYGRGSWISLNISEKNGVKLMLVMRLLSNLLLQCNKLILMFICKR